MPYIVQEAREAIDSGESDPHTVGELTYVLYREMLSYLKGKRRGLSYALLAEVKSAADNASAEFYRSIIGPYEDQKRAENGDIL